MNFTRLNNIFFDKDTCEVARSLLGHYLIHETPEGVLAGIINDVEAYTENDPASHTYLGKKTKRNAPMYGEPGTLYIYFIYGMYYCLNIVTESKGTGCAILIRGVIPRLGQSLMQAHRPNSAYKNLCNGPAKLVQAFNISPNLNNVSMSKSPLYISEQKEALGTVNKLPRVGIQKGKNLLWRYVGFFSL